MAGLWMCASLAAAPSPLKVAGNQLLDGGGRPPRLRGVNCAGLEWSNDGGGRIRRTVAVAVEDWHANIIRLPLSQDRWFGRASGQEDGGASYRQLVRQLVDYCSAHDAYLILDLHWSDAGQWGRHIGQHDLPDQNSVAFWKDLAPAFANDPAVLFDLYNEPTHITWDQWYRGGPITEHDKKTGVTLNYEGVGLPALVATIRATGAGNVIVAGGINWAYELGGILRGREPADPTGNGIVYAVHPYPHAYEGLGRETIAQWAARMERFAQVHPIIVTEFGSLASSWPFPKGSGYDDERWNREMLGVLEAHRWNWTAWDFHVSAAPCLISDWNYTPTPQFGRWVQQALAANGAR
jgi:Cellulase (glycosyl hydrolase family 5)